MFPAKCDDLDYINLLIAANKVFSNVETAKTDPTEDQASPQDAYTRLRQRMPPDSQQIVPLNERQYGVLAIDDPSLDKPVWSKNLTTCIFSRNYRPTSSSVFGKLLPLSTWD
jgi:hypothetical protein